MAGKKKGCDTGMGTREIALFGLLASIALIFGYIEAIFPLPIPVPGIKLGLGNIVVLLALLAFGPRAAFMLMVVKVVSSSLLFGNLAVMMYSLAGGVASVAAMCLAVRLPRVSAVGVSMAGGVFHMMGQAAVVAFVLTPAVALTYLPVLIVSGLVTGALTGFICRMVIRSVADSPLLEGHRASKPDEPAPADGDAS